MSTMNPENLVITKSSVAISSAHHDGDAGDGDDDEPFLTRPCFAVLNVLGPKRLRMS